MKKIEEGAEIYYQSNEYQKSNSLNRFDNIFKAGVEFAQRWISVEDELPEFDKSKYPDGDFEIFLVRMSVGSISPKIKYCVANLIMVGRWSCEFDWNVVTHWRPIELK